MHGKQLAIVLGGLVAILALPGCSLDIPDLNNPGLEQLENNPTTASINTAATGLLVGDRGGKANTTGLVNQLGILGRESYDFDSADVRFVSELIQGNLSKASPFGGSFWGGNYANIRLANIILHGVDKVAGYTDTNRSAIRGYVHTIQALELLTVITTHDDTGAVIDTDHPLGEPLGPFVPKAAVYTEIARLLDQGQTELAAGGTAFTFPLSPGYTGFNTPPNFIKVNRAIRARVAVFQKDYPTALAALGMSFLNDNPATLDLKAGVFHVYSLSAGDATNGLINPAIFAHPKLQTDAQKQADGMTVDARYTAKIDPLKNPVAAGSDASLKTGIKFKIYTNIAPVPLIRNEELILLKAEALYYTNDQAGALAELNIVRTKSGNLPALTGFADEAAFVDALLYERRYSLMFEGGHRWIDLRRFGRLTPDLLDSTAHVLNRRFPVPQAECDARPGEKACTINSSDPVN
ncbi:MAG: RagB/SusD family nutrient uptake outer membrane protein [Deltaproteobacteria bacterium]|nr:MAG: RagB/SusD family nutrient uptake outer membrane protein [Deltaproteobacteria bacterium]